ncbi:MAG: DUF3862 domain-containing protein [Myxococcota bacterium]|mgnify:FL=1|jgi:hypothetical protein|nr:DUF3862 domain-containing protein [Myxococcota bacterium]MDP6243188.1 DUF3862 domain-containing protein [Myxococcota bacterium]MDP7074901.1 DUF3862 domain-containing protein [Myxococcota bacterium]MDP7300120.1 DUF3862 domain-containing protein [Myxococcota bacterium]MDP7434501.1 DUF3862 domain-containing protein [Myxococcota bacterium]
MKKLSKELKLVIAGTLLVLIVPSVCSVVTIGIGMVANDVKTQDLGKGEDPPPIVTLAEFEQIEIGMSYREVVDILGEPGVVIAPPAEAGAREVETIRYVWQNSDVSNMKATFENGQLTGKAQLYLK